MVYNKKCINFSEIEKETFNCSEQTIYEILWDGVKYEFCINNKRQSNKAVIFGPSAFDVSQRDEFPLFHRISWSEYISCTGIWYFDPTIYLGNDLRVGWGYGTNDRWYLKDIAQILRIILRKLNIEIKNTLFYGSSAGGFTSIILATMFRSKATVVNTQFSVRKYSTIQLQKLEKAALKEGETFIEERLNVTEFMNKEQYVPTIHIVDNVLSKSDIFSQLTALTRGLFEYKLDCTNRITIDFFSDERGHNGVPSQVESIKMIEWDMHKSFALDTFLLTILKKGKNVASRFLHGISSRK